MKITAQITERSIWVDVGPDEVHSKLKCGVLTLRTDSPFYEEGTHRPTAMLTAYTCFKGEYHDFLKAAKKFTCLDIEEYETHYTIQFRVLLDGKITESEALRSLQQFVAKHFKPYDPVADEKAHMKDLKKRVGS